MEPSMEVVLSHEELQSAIALYLAMNGLTRNVTNLTFSIGRKNSAGQASCQVSLAESTVSADTIQKLAQARQGEFLASSGIPTIESLSAGEIPTGGMATAPSGSFGSSGSSEAATDADTGNMQAASSEFGSSDFGDPAPKATPEELGAGETTDTIATLESMEETTAETTAEEASDNAFGSSAASEAPLTAPNVAEKTAQSEEIAAANAATQNLFG